MKILTQEQTDEILKRVMANEIMAMEYIHNEDVTSQMIDNNLEIIKLVGGIKGLVKIINTMENYIK